MEPENIGISLTSATHLTSSWPIIRSSLDDVVTCESSISAVDSTSDSDHTAVFSRKPPLILRRPTPDSSPCEITILFTQQHEVKQVYVRSTARVYEIYYAANKKGDNEYLCTVRCGVAARAEELLQESDGVESLSTSFSSSNRSSCEGHISSESTGNANEDGWVDVKVHNPSMLNAGDGCLAKEDESCMELGNQDFFEATAEISDADPVLSVTLRLLSIQSGDHIYIDEIYVFADPVVSTDTNISTSAQETSTESATVSLLIPTLLNISKLRRNQEQKQIDSSEVGRKHQDAEHKSVAVMMPGTCQTESIQGTMLNNATKPMSEPHLPVQRLDTQNTPCLTNCSTSKRNDISGSRIERTLDELVSRVAKIEHFCLRFEENMLKPISNMESRLERVEQQLDSFVETAKFSVTAHTNISSPESSCIESESNSVFTGGYEAPVTSNSKSIMKNESEHQDLSIPSSNANSLGFVPSNDVSSSATDQLIPGLVVTAPDFSCVDDEGEIDTYEAVKNSPKGSPKKPLSIDDALASAFAGFLSSASIDTNMSKEAANASCKEESGNPYPTELIQPHDHTVPSAHIDGCNISGRDILRTEQESFGTDNGVEEATESVDEHSLLSEKEDSEKALGSSVCNGVNLDSVATEVSDLSMDVSVRAADDDSNSTFGLDSFDFCDKDNSVDVLDIPVDDIDSSSGEETTKPYPAVLLNILNMQRSAVLDFETPILDVKFSSLESFPAKSSLDALLVDVPELESEAPCVEEENAASFSEQNDLVMIGSVDSAISDALNNQSFCLDNVDSSCMPSLIQEELQDPCKCSTQDTGASLI